MSLDNRLLEINARQRELDAMLAETKAMRYSNDGSGGGGSAVDARLTRLEGQYDKLRDDNVAIRESLATLNERVAHLPSKEFIVKVVGGALAIIAALATFAEKLQALVR